jgi:hypothetical protein
MRRCFSLILKGVDMPENTQVRVVNKGEYLLITTPPYQSVSQTESVISAMYDAIDRQNCRKLLIDVRATRKQVPIMELYEICLYLVSKFGHTQVKMAVMASPEAVYPDRFGENVARNRGLDLIRFIGDEQEALNWLLAAQPAKPSMQR